MLGGHTSGHVLPARIDAPIGACKSRLLTFSTMRPGAARTPARMGILVCMACMFLSLCIRAALKAT